MSFPKVTIVGAGQVGATAAFLMLEKCLADVTLIDVAEGIPQGKALDMMHSRSIEQFGPVVAGTNDYEETAGSDVVVVTAGLPRKPGMTRDDLLAANSAIVTSVVEQAMAVSPDALLLMVTNPLDVMTYLARKISGLPASRVMGMGGVLDSARFAYAIAEHTAAPVTSIEALACGAHGDAMVPLPAHSYVAGTRLTELLPADEVDALVKRTIFGGAEVVSLLKTGSAFYAPAASVVRMVSALLGGECAPLPSCVYLEGQYGISDVYLSVPAVLDTCGVREIPEMDLSPTEIEALRASADSVIDSLRALGLRD
jgi:malate dehydrogenase